MPLKRDYYQVVNANIDKANWPNEFGYHVVLAYETQKRSFVSHKIHKLEQFKSWFWTKNN